MMETPTERKFKMWPFVILILALTFPLSSPFCAGETDFRNSIGMEFVMIPAGTFIMGSPKDEAQRDTDEVQHQVAISKAFYMQTTEVTLGQWWAIMGKPFLFGRRKGGKDTPVVKVSWFECMEFIEKLNARRQGTYRLPSEAEWEYACRSGSTTPYSWGSDIDCGKAMYENNSMKENLCVEDIKSRGLPVDRPAPVKTYPPNAWGLFDMHGNVWEWCVDWYGPYPSEPILDPSGPDSGSKRVRRGGSWFGLGSSCRSANRNWAHPAFSERTIGFRLVWVGDVKTMETQKTIIKGRDVFESRPDGP
jgi:sulfatase modifying factor 1